MGGASLQSVIDVNCCFLDGVLGVRPLERYCGGRTHLSARPDRGMTGCAYAWSKRGSDGQR